MTTTAISFGDIEFSTNRTLAYAILASQAAKNYLVAVYRMYEVEGALEDLLAVLGPDRLEMLDPDQKTWLTPKLQEVHHHLANFSRSHEAETISKLPLLGNSVAKLQEYTEDLDDVIEDLVLVSDKDFRNLIAACAKSIDLPTEAPFARLHD